MYFLSITTMNNVHVIYNFKLTVLVHQCQSTKVGAENIIAVVDNTVRATHIHKHSLSNTMAANRHSPLNSKVGFTIPFLYLESREVLKKNAAKTR
jgi:hypothetical protein